MRIERYMIVILLGIIGMNTAFDVVIFEILRFLVMGYCIVTLLYIIGEILPYFRKNKKGVNNVRFISNFDNYTKERWGDKRNHVVREDKLPYAKKVKLNAFIKDNISCSITIQKGYTTQSFTKEITDITAFENRVIISW